MTAVTKFVAAFALIGLFGSPVRADQTPAAPAPSSANPVSDTIRQMLARSARILVAAAEEMPADTYGYHPTPAQMTFGALVAHVAQTNDALCTIISDAIPTSMTPLPDTTPKEGLVAAMKKSFDACTTVLANINDTELGDPVHVGPVQTVSRARLMITIATDWADHYSTAAAYLRLNGLLPPTAQPAAPRAR